MTLKSFTPQKLAPWFFFLSGGLLFSGHSIFFGSEILANVPNHSKADTAPTTSHTQAETAPCAILRKFEGWVRLMDASRTHLIETQNQAGIPCGSWATTEDGWAEIKHQRGPTLHLGPHSFVQFVPPPPDSSHSRSYLRSKMHSHAPIDDQVVLYRGQLYVHAGNGSEEFRILSQVGRARIQNAQAIFISNAIEDETQLIALDHPVSLENRFLADSRVAIRPGEASTLHFKLLRVVPSVPRTLSAASLKPLLEDLQIPDKAQSTAVQNAMKRLERNVLTESEAEDLKNQTTATKEGRKVASTTSPKITPIEEPESTTTDESEIVADPALSKHLIEKTTGGAPVNSNILYPSPFYGRTQKIRVEVEAPDDSSVLGSDKKGSAKKLRHEELAEKRRLIKELSRIHAD